MGTSVGWGEKLHARNYRLLWELQLILLRKGWGGAERKERTLQGQNWENPGAGYGGLLLEGIEESNGSQKFWIWFMGPRKEGKGPTLNLWVAVKSLAFLSLRDWYHVLNVPKLISYALKGSRKHCWGWPRNTITPGIVPGNSTPLLTFLSLLYAPHHFQNSHGFAHSGSLIQECSFPRDLNVCTSNGAHFDDFSKTRNSSAYHPES